LPLLLKLRLPFGLLILWLSPGLLVLWLRPGLLVLWLRPGLLILWLRPGLLVLWLRLGLLILWLRFRLLILRLGLLILWLWLRLLILRLNLGLLVLWLRLCLLVLRLRPLSLGLPLLDLRLSMLLDLRLFTLLGLWICRGRMLFLFFLLVALGCPNKYRHNQQNQKGKLLPQDTMTSLAWIHGDPLNNSERIRAGWEARMTDHASGATLEINQNMIKKSSMSSVLRRVAQPIRTLPLEF
jgi:hypothetical protein